MLLTLTLPIVLLITIVLKHQLRGIRINSNQLTNQLVDFVLEDGLCSVSEGGIVNSFAGGRHNLGGLNLEWGIAVFGKHRHLVKTNHN